MNQGGFDIPAPPGLVIDCPTCAAVKGAPCQGTAGTRIIYHRDNIFHPARVEAAWGVWGGMSDKDKTTYCNERADYFGDKAEILRRLISDSEKEIELLRLALRCEDDLDRP